MTVVVTYSRRFSLMGPNQHFAVIVLANAFFSVSISREQHSFLTLEKQQKFSFENNINSSLLYAAVFQEGSETLRVLDSHGIVKIKIILFNIKMGRYLSPFYSVDIYSDDAKPSWIKLL